MAEFIFGVLVGAFVMFAGLFKVIIEMAKGIVKLKEFNEKLIKEKEETVWRNNAILSTFEAETIKALKKAEEEKLFEKINKIMKS